MALTFFLMEHAERLQQLMFGTLHHTQTGLGLILKGPDGEWMVLTVSLKGTVHTKALLIHVMAPCTVCYLRVKGMASKRRSTSLKNVREVFIFRPYCLLGSLL